MRLRKSQEIPQTQNLALQARLLRGMGYKVSYTAQQAGNGRKAEQVRRLWGKLSPGGRVWVRTKRPLGRKTPKGQLVPARRNIAGDLIPTTYTETREGVSVTYGERTDLMIPLDFGPLVANTLGYLTSVTAPYADSRGFTLVANGIMSSNRYASLRQFLHYVRMEFSRMVDEINARPGSRPSFSLQVTL